MEHVMKAREIVFAYVKEHHLEEKFVLNVAVGLKQAFVVILFRWLFYGYKRWFFPFRLVVLIIFCALLCALEMKRYSEPLLKKYGLYHYVESTASAVFGGGSGGGSSGGFGGGLDGGSSGGSSRSSASSAFPGSKSEIKSLSEARPDPSDPSLKKPKSSPKHSSSGPKDEL